MTAASLVASTRKHAYRYAESLATRQLSVIASHRPLPKAKVSWLDLRGTGLSAIERLAIEELLLRHDPMKRCWAIIGVHEPTENRILNTINQPSYEPTSSTITNDQNSNYDAFGPSNDEERNTSCAIIMGIGGKAERLIDIESVKRNGVLVLRRFSGGGTVVVDHSSLWTTFIGRNEIMPQVVPYPREIMQWSADAIFGPAFDRWTKDIQHQSSVQNNNEISRGKSKRQTLVVHGKSCGLCGGDNESIALPTTDVETSLTQTSTITTLPTFRLRENDYILDSMHGERKIGGNAQAIVSG